MPKYSEYASSAHPPVQRHSIVPKPWELNTYSTVHTCVHTHRLTTAVSSYKSSQTDAHTICAGSINTVWDAKSHCGRKGDGGQRVI